MEHYAGIDVSLERSFALWTRASRQLWLLSLTRLVLL
jgi:hypothetical protein